MGQQDLNGVTNFYGPRHRHEGTEGRMGSNSEIHHLVILIAGDSYTGFTGTLPKGAMLAGKAMVEVEEAFVLGGTTPTIAIGVSGSEVTNAVAVVSEAQAEAVGTYAVASAGTLALETPLAAAVTLKVALGGTSPTITSAGKMKVVVPYRVI